MTDELLRRLGRAERESRLADEWDEVLEGRMSADEAMERSRARGDSDGLEALARASTALTEPERKKWTSHARAALQTTDDDDAPTAPPSADAPVDLARQRARRRWGWGGLATLVAVAAALVLWLRARPDAGDLGVEGEPLPPFTMIIRNDTVTELRGADDATLEGPAPYRPDSRVHWSFQPDAPISGALELAAVVHGDDLSCLARPTVARASADGALELRGTVDETLGLGPGRWTLDVIVARAGSLPADETGCDQPRDLPCPCPVPLHPGARIERADLEPERGAAAWRRVRSYEMLIEPLARRR